MNEATSRATQILLKKFEESCQRNSRWSQRAFAQKVGLSSGALSEILKGKRPLSPAIKKKLAAKLQLSPQEQMEFFEEELPGHLMQRRLDYVKLSNDQFHLISDWWHYAILNLVKTKGFRPFPTWIAKRLGISMNLANEAWERLLRLGHLTWNKNKQIIRKDIRLETTDDFFDLSIRKSHLEDLKLIERSILEDAIEKRDHTSMTLVLNKSDIPKAKEMIRLFQDNLSERIETNPGEEVYRLSVSLFPLTRTEEKK